MNQIQTHDSSVNLVNFDPSRPRGWWNRPREHVWNRQKGGVDISDLAARQMGAATADAAPKR